MSKQFDSRDAWLVVEEWPAKRPIETHYTLGGALQAIEWLTEHERMNGRATIYGAVANTKETKL